MQRALLLAACACRGGFQTDETPDAVDWPDFNNVSVAQTITGVNNPIEAQLSVVYGSGTPQVEYRVDAGDWVSFAPGAAATVILKNDDTLQFRVSGTLNHSAAITVRNASDGDVVLDTTVGIISTPVIGSGTPGSPYSVPGATPASCAVFLAMYPSQLGLDGSYAIDPGTPFDAYCDMTSDDGGWTLIARVTATSTTHTTAAAVGTLVDAKQTSTAKLADNVINMLGFAMARFDIASAGAIYVRATALDLAGTAEFMAPNTAATASTGPFTYTFLTQTSCNSDCGIDVVRPAASFGNNCGYRYYSSSGNPRPGMGCQGSFGKDGTAWVK